MPKGQGNAQFEEAKKASAASAPGAAPPGAAPAPQSPFWVQQANQGNFQDAARRYNSRYAGQRGIGRQAVAEGIQDPMQRQKFWEALRTLRNPGGAQPPQQPQSSLAALIQSMNPQQVQQPESGGGMTMQEAPAPEPHTWGQPPVAIEGLGGGLSGYTPGIDGPPPTVWTPEWQQQLDQSGGMAGRLGGKSGGGPAGGKGVSRMKPTIPGY